MLRRSKQQLKAVQRRTSLLMRMVVRRRRPRQAEQVSARTCFGEVGRSHPATRTIFHCACLFAPLTCPLGLIRNLVAFGLVHPPPPSFSLWMPYMTGGCLSNAGTSLLPFLSLLPSAPLGQLPSIPASKFSLRKNLREGKGMCAYMVFDSDMLLTPPLAVRCFDGLVGSIDKFTHLLQKDDAASKGDEQANFWKGVSRQKRSQSKGKGKGKSKGGKRKARRPRAGGSFKRSK